MTEHLPTSGHTVQLRFAQLGKPALGRSIGRTLLALACLGGGVVVVAAALITALVASGAGELLLADETWMFGPLGTALGLLVMPVLVLPPAWLTARWLLRMHLGEVCSVTGRFRWGLYWRCVAVAAVVAAVSTLLSHWWTGTAPEGIAEQWLVLLAIIACGVPVAAFAEELAFRGVLTHILGARWVSSSVAVAVPAVITAVLFSLAHGPAGAVPFLMHAAGGVAYAVLCDRTGGLEASTAAHTAWNLALLGWTSLFAIGGADTAESPGVAFHVLLTDLAIVAALLLSLRSQGVKRLRTVSAPETASPAVVQGKPYG